LDHKTYSLDGEVIKVGLRVDRFDFSAHGDRSELLKTINKVNPEKVFVIHGDYCEKFAAELKEMGFNAFAPEVGNKFSL